MPSTPEFFFDGPQSSQHPISPRFALEKEMTGSRLPADMGKAEKVERLRFPKAVPRSTFCRKANEFNQTGLVRMQR